MHLSTDRMTLLKRIPPKLCLPKKTIESTAWIQKHLTTRLPRQQTKSTNLETDLKKTRSNHQTSR